MADEPKADTTDQADRPLSPNELLEAEEVIRRERYFAAQRMRALATDDGDASHEGGMGAQGGQADFSRP